MLLAQNNLLYTIEVSIYIADETSTKLPITLYKREP